MCIFLFMPFNLMKCFIFFFFLFVVGQGYCQHGTGIGVVILFCLSFLFIFVWCFVSSVITVCISCCFHQVLALWLYIFFQQKNQKKTSSACQYIHNHLQTQLVCISVYFSPGYHPFYICNHTWRIVKTGIITTTIICQ